MLSALFVVIALLGYMSYEQGFFKSETLPYDEEQEGLKDQITIRFSHVVAEDTPKGQAVLKFAELVQKRSHHRIQVEISPNGMLYNDVNELQALKDNDVQMIAPTLSKVTKEVPSWEVLDFPYLFSSTAEVQKVFTSDVGERLLNELQHENMKALGFWQNGFKQMINEKEIIQDVQDFKGLRVRAMESDMLKQQFEQVKATPVTSSFDELFTELNKQKMDALENTISNIYSKSLYKKENHLTISNHGILAYAVIINKQFWQQLEPADQQLIEQALKDATEWNMENAMQMNDHDLQQLKNLSVEIHTLTPQQQTAWKKAFMPLYRSFENRSDAHYLHEIQQLIQKKTDT